MNGPRPPWANPAFVAMRGLLVVLALVVAVGAFAAGRTGFGIAFLLIAAVGVVVLVASRRIR
jgi:hypothetical protein